MSMKINNRTQLMMPPHLNAETIKAPNTQSGFLGFLNKHLGHQDRTDKPMWTLFR